MAHARRFLAPLSLLLLAASAHAQPALRYSWDACDPVVTNRDFAGPGTYVQTLSATNMSGPVDGFQVEIGVGTPIYPAWQFYSHVPGCQSAASFSVSPHAGGCADLQGLQLIAEMDPGLTDPVHAFISIKGFTGAPFTPDPAVRYGLVRLSFDHSNSGAGFQGPPRCGEADAPLCFHILGASLFHPSAPGESMLIENGFVTWQDARNALGCPGATPTRAQTWGSIKTLYR